MSNNFTTKQTNLSMKSKPKDPNLGQRISTSSTNPSKYTTKTNVKLPTSRMETQANTYRIDTELSTSRKPHGQPQTQQTIHTFKTDNLVSIQSLEDLEEQYMHHNEYHVGKIDLGKVIREAKVKSYSESAPYEQRLHTSLESGFSSQPREKDTFSNTSTQFEFLNRTSTNGRLFTEDYSDHKYRINLSSFYHYDKSDAEHKEKFDPLRKKNLDTSRSNQKDKKRILRLATVVDRSMNLSVGHRTSDSIDLFYNKVVDKKALKTEVPVDNVDRLYTSYFPEDPHKNKNNIHHSGHGQHKNPAKQYKTKKHQEFKRLVCKHNTSLRDDRMANEHKFRNLPDYNYVNNCVDKGLIVQNFVNEAKKRIELVNVFNSQRDKPRFDTLVEYMQNFEDNQLPKYKDFVKYILIQQNNLTLFGNVDQLVSQRIKFLTITKCKLHKQALATILDKLKLSPYKDLKYLNLSDNQLDSSHLNYLFANLSDFDGLHSVDVSGNSYDSPELGVLEQTLNPKCPLKKLWLASCGMDFYAVAVLLMALSNNRKVRELNLGSNKLNSCSREVARAKDYFSTFMLSNKTVTHLYLSDCRVDRPTAQYLVGQFLLRPTLMYIHCNANQAYFDSISTIATAYIYKIKKLFKVDLYMCVHCDMHRVREFRLDADNFPDIQEYRGKNLRIHLEYYEFNPLKLPYIEDYFYTRLILPPFEMAFYLTVDDDVLLQVNLDGIFEEYGEGTQSAEYSEGLGGHYPMSNGDNDVHYPHLAERGIKCYILPVELKKKPVKISTQSLSTSDYQYKLKNYLQVKAFDQMTTIHQFENDQWKTQTLNRKTKVDALYQKDPPTTFDRSKLAKFDVNVKNTLKIKKPIVGLAFMNSDEVKSDQVELEYLKTINTKKVFKDSCAFDINHSNTYKYLNEGLKIDEKLMLGILNSLMKVNYEKFVDVYFYLMAVNTTRWNDVTFQIRDKCFYSFCQSIDVYDDNLTFDKLELAFFSVNNDYSGNTVQQGAPEGNAENLLVRKELFELLLRMSVIKWWDGKDSSAIAANMDRLILHLWAHVPVQIKEFREYIEDEPDLAKSFEANRIIFKMAFKEASDKKHLSWESFVKQLKQCGVDILPSEFVYHWCASINLSADDYVVNRYLKCDFGQYIEVWFRIFRQHSNRLLSQIDYDLFLYLYKIDRKYLMFKLNRLMRLKLDMAVLLFVQMLTKCFNRETRINKDELNDGFSKAKTLIYYSNTFYEEDISDDEEEYPKFHLNFSTTRKNSIQEETRSPSIKMRRTSTVSTSMTNVNSFLSIVNVNTKAKKSETLNSIDEED